MIRSVRPTDASAICGIYNYYIENTAITFEEKCLSAVQMEAIIGRVSASYPYFVWEDEGEVTAYAYLSPFHERSAYRFSACDSIYVKNGLQGGGRGKALLTALLDEARRRGFHSVTALITMPNATSVGLHEQFGFKQAGYFSEIGYKMNQWLDVGYWQKVFID